MRLIDADELKLSHCVECTLYPDNCLEKDGGDCDWEAIYHLKYCVKTVDAVPVVRCRECEGWVATENSDLGLCVLTKRVVTRRDYCSEGKRKDGDRDG